MGRRRDNGSEHATAKEMRGIGRRDTVLYGSGGVNFAFAGSTPRALNFVLLLQVSILIKLNNAEPVAPVRLENLENVPEKLDVCASL